jgi:hypothetical protein
MKCVQKCEGHYSDTEMGLFLDPEKYDKFERQRFSLAKFQGPCIVRICAYSRWKRDILNAHTAISPPLWWIWTPGHNISRVPNVGRRAVYLVVATGIHLSVVQVVPLSKLFVDAL